MDDRLRTNKLNKTGKILSEGRQYLCNESYQRWSPTTYSEIARVPNEVLQLDLYKPIHWSASSHCFRRQRLTDLIHSFQHYLPQEDSAQIDRRSVNNYEAYPKHHVVNLD